MVDRRTRTNHVMARAEHRGCVCGLPRALRMGDGTSLVLAPGRLTMLSAVQKHPVPVVETAAGPPSAPAPPHQDFMLAQAASGAARLVAVVITAAGKARSTRLCREAKSCPAGSIGSTGMWHTRRMRRIRSRRARDTGRIARSLYLGCYVLTIRGILQLLCLRSR